MKPFRYLFYRSYRVEPRITGSLAWVAPLAMTAVLCSLNLLALYVLALWLLGMIPEGGIDFKNGKPVFILVIATLTVLLYIRWIVTGRYLAFAKEFRSESTAQWRLRTVLVYAYGFGSIVTPMVVGYFISQR